MSPFSSQWTTFLKMFLILWTLITRLRRRLSFSIRRIPLWPSVSSSSACVCPTIFCITWPLIFAWREKYGFLKMKGLLWVLIDIYPLIPLHRFPSRTSVGSQSSTISYWIHYILIAWILSLRRGWSPITCSWSLRCSSPCCSQSSWEGIRDLSTQLSTLFQ